MDLNKNVKKEDKNTAYPRIFSLSHCLVLMLLPSVPGQTPTSQLHQFLNGPPIHLIEKLKKKNHQFYYFLRYSIN